MLRGCVGLIDTTTSIATRTCAHIYPDIFRGRHPCDVNFFARQLHVFRAELEKAT